MKKLKIGFFGDSFCSADLQGTYIQKLATHFDAEVTHLGVGGSSIEDVVLIQLKEVESNYPDVCVFAWSDMNRIYHSIVRNMNVGSVVHGPRPKKNHAIWQAAKFYYQYLFDVESTKLRYMSLLHYFDTVLLTKLPESTKIIHLWSFADLDKWCDIPNASYSYRFLNGYEIRPSLFPIAIIGRNIDEFGRDTYPNHFNTEEKNQLVFEWIKDAIENYENGKLKDESNIIPVLRKRQNESSTI